MTIKNMEPKIGTKPIAGTTNSTYTVIKAKAKTRYTARRARTGRELDRGRERSLGTTDTHVSFFLNVVLNPIPRPSRLGLPRKGFPLADSLEARS